MRSTTLVFKTTLWKTLLSLHKSKNLAWATRPVQEKTSRPPYRGRMLDSGQFDLGQSGFFDLGQWSTSARHTRHQSRHTHKADTHTHNTHNTTHTTQHTQQTHTHTTHTTPTHNNTTNTEHQHNTTRKWIGQHWPNQGRVRDGQHHGVREAWKGARARPGMCTGGRTSHLWEMRGWKLHPCLCRFRRRLVHRLGHPRPKMKLQEFSKRASAVRPWRDPGATPESEVESPLIKHAPSHAWRTSTWTVGW